jgi:hypothetical protein
VTVRRRNKTDWDMRMWSTLISWTKILWKKIMTDHALTSPPTSHTADDSHWYWTTSHRRPRTISSHSWSSDSFSSRSSPLSSSINCTPLYKPPTIIQSTYSPPSTNTINTLMVVNDGDTMPSYPTQQTTIPMLTQA